MNVKTVKIEDMSGVARKICKPNAKLIGPRFGKAVQDVIREAKSGNFQELENGRIKIPPTPFVKGEENKNTPLIKGEATKEQGDFFLEA